MVFSLSEYLMLVLYSLKTNNWKIIDFGMSCEATSKRLQTSRNSRGTTGYRAPELVVPETPRYSNKVDIWALGCILYELCLGEKTFTDDWVVRSYATSNVVRDISISGLHESLQSLISASFADLLRVEPEKRPRSRTLHVIFRTYCQLFHPSFRPEYDTRFSYGPKHLSYPSYSNLQQALAKPAANYLQSEIRLAEVMAECNNNIPIAVLLNWANIFPYSKDCLHALGMAWRRKRNWRQEILVWKKILTQFPYDPAYVYRLEEACKARADPVADIVDWRSLIYEWLPRAEGEVVSNLAMAYGRNGSHIVAEVNLWKQLVAKYPHISKYRESLASAYQRKGDTDAAIVIWSSLVIEFPSDRRFVKGLINALWIKGDEESKITVWSALLLNNPEEFDFFEELQVACDKSDKALGIWKSLFQKHPDHLYFGHALATSYWKKRGGIVGEIGIWMEIVNKYRNVELCDQLLKLPSADRGRSPGIALCEELVQRYPTDPGWRSWLARMCQNVENIDLEIEIWEGLLHKYSKTTDVVYYFTDACHRKGGASEIELLTRVWKKDSGNRHLSDRLERVKRVIHSAIKS